jgi:hypothetical protein
MLVAITTKRRGSADYNTFVFRRSQFRISRFYLKHKHNHFDVELRLSPGWVGGNIGSTDATKTCYTLNAYIFETNNRKIINSTSLDSL